MMLLIRNAVVHPALLVVYEMLTGQRLFEGESVTDSLAAVLTKEPEWNRVPVKAQQLLRSCLEKDPSGGCATSAMLGGCWKIFLYGLQ